MAESFPILVNLTPHPIGLSVDGVVRGRGGGWYPRAADERRDAARKTGAG